MAHSLSSKKRIRQNLKHRARNRARKIVLKERVKAFTVALSAGNIEQAKAELLQTVRRLDQTAAHHTIHKNAAARKRSRLTRQLNAAILAAKAGKGPGKEPGKGAKTAGAA